MIRIGLVGAKDSIMSIYEVGKEYESQAEFTCYPYVNKEDTVALVQDNIHEMDVILFSGRVPYSIAKNQLKISKPCVYVPHNGSCIYRTLWEIQSAGLPLEGVSFDTIDEKEVREIYKELKLNDEGVTVFEFEGDVDYERLADYHVKKHELNSNHVAVTCLYRTYEILEELKIPAFRVNLTKSLIRQVIENAIYEGNNTILKANQIAVAILDIDDFKKHIKLCTSEYDVQKLKLKFNEMLIDYAKTIEGSIFNFGNDEYLLFTTGGAMESDSNHRERRTFVERVRNELGISVSIGIGYGKSAYEAETHGRIGVKHAKLAGGDCIFIVDLNKNVIGPLEEEGLLEFSYQSNDKTVVALAELTGLNVKNILKIMSVVEKNGNQHTSKDLAFYLNITERSARRILSTLHESGLAEINGEENASSKGRPRNVYRIQLKHLT